MTEALIQRLVHANHILANEGLLGGLGHVSARTPTNDSLLISQSRSPAFVAPNDVLRMRFDGTLLDDAEGSPYKETVIHRAIYRHRDDVGAVVHYHAPSVMPFTVSDVELKPVFHLGAPFRTGVETFDDYDSDGGYLVVTEAEGERMAAELGDDRAQLLAGHGANVVGANLKEVVVAAIYLAMNAAYQFQAEQLGVPTYLTGEEMLATTENEAVLDPMVIERVWEYHLRRLSDRP